MNIDYRKLEKLNEELLKIEEKLEKKSKRRKVEIDFIKKGKKLSESKSNKNIIVKKKKSENIQTSFDI